MSPRTVCDRLGDVLDAIEKATRYAARDRHDEAVIAATKYELVVLGEAVNALLRDDPGLEERRSDIPWRAITGMRNRLVHEYERTDPGFVFGTVDADLGPLRTAVEEERDRRRCS